MPNNCYFKMRITGPEAGVCELADMIARTGRYSKEDPMDGLGRVFSFEISELVPMKRDPKTGFVSIEGQGDCAWSVNLAMREWPPGTMTLESETKRLGLAVEYFSSENDLEFQEHGIIICGQAITDETVHYEEHFVEEMEPLELDELCEETGLTLEDIKKGTNVNGDFCIGGVENFGEYRDLFSLLKEHRALSYHPPLSERLQDASTRAADKSNETSSPSEVPKDRSSEDRER